MSAIINHIDFCSIPSMNAIKWNQRHTRDECIDKIFTFYARVSCKRRNFFMKVKEMMCRWVGWRHQKLEHILPVSMKVSTLFISSYYRPYNRSVDWNLLFFLIVNLTPFPFNRKKNSIFILCWINLIWGANNDVDK